MQTSKLQVLLMGLSESDSQETLPADVIKTYAENPSSEWMIVKTYDEGQRKSRKKLNFEAGNSRFDVLFCI